MTLKSAPRMPDASNFLMNPPLCPVRVNGWILGGLDGAIHRTK